MKIRIALITLSIISFLIPTQQANALSCMDSSLENEFSKSLAVFMGTVNSTTVDGGDAFIKVTYAWKGVKVGDVADTTSEDPDGWGVKFKEGYTYLVFSRTTNPYTVALCQYSREVITQLHVDNAKNDQEREYYQSALADQNIYIQEMITNLNQLASASEVQGNHNSGTNVRLPDGTVYRISENKVLQPYTSAGAFLSYKFNSWAGVVEANSSDLALPKSTDYIPPRNGSLIVDKGTVYLITNGQRAGFTTESVFSGSQANGLNYSYANVYPGDTSFMTTLSPVDRAEQRHPDGTLINDNSTLYVMQNGYRVGFPSMSVLDSWGYWVTEAVPANSYDREAQVSGVMQTRMVNQMSI